MKREVIAEKIETRRNERADDPLTLSERHYVDLGDRYGKGRLTVEYKPRDRRLDAVGLAPLAVEGIPGDDSSIEEFVSDLYWALVDVLYPQSSYLDEPWTVLPLIVELESKTDDETSSYFTSVGTLR